ncbi:exodeoxyribonuclease I [Thiospirochaeta perfilievii]|uniref:Exodeoxyribonuclease I n=1 Tax=Thiospirochaeta perfilievii TaxID=252967 RepID=A0A5C1QDB5_9SPIO|nr:exodeoxyribonuclease I [Thiospirochaeta perfilievii]QEN06103.1 exodeoxyribonuclease I [Thiospirochaeta perfilievii]
MADTLFWYDLETFGRNPAWDKVAQFAGIRTNEKFEIIGEPIVLYCKITPDYIPDPVACYITGITPQLTIEKGLTEYEFIKRIDKEFSQPGTCVVGYNSINFDDEFIRNLYYRNFKDPYLREWSRGNTRWDILNLVRGVHDFRPEGLQWLNHENGKPSFKLEELSKINGIIHDNAHDALSDVEATIGLAKKIYEAQPKFFKFNYSLRKKEGVKKYIDIFSRKPFYHTSGMFTSVRGCTTMLSPIAVDPINKNSIICYDLRYDPSDLIKLSVEEIQSRLFVSDSNLSSNESRVHLKCVHINKSPMISPLGTLTEQASLKLGIDTKVCLENYDKLKDVKELTQKVIKVFQPNSGQVINKDPDFQIYSGGFFRDEDKAKFTMIHNTRKEDLLDLNHNFEDSRISEMLWRFVCRNYPEVLSSKDLDKWRSFCATRTLYPPCSDALDIKSIEEKLNLTMESKETSNKDKLITRELLQYIDVLKRKILN